MFIKRVQLFNFRSFEGLHSFFFDKLNLIVGRNGSGKSSLSRIAITFVLYGDSEVSLSNLVTKGIEDGWASLLIEDKGEEIYIQRNIPTKLHITVNAIEILPEATNVEKQKWIETRFKDLHYFRKFRMIDLKLGLNLLEEGKTALRKTIVNLNEGFLNNVKDRLQKKKTLYDKFNKDTAVIYSHAPSVSRLEALFRALNGVVESESEITKEVHDQERSYYDLSAKRSVLTSEDRKANEKRIRVEKEKNCPTCKQELPEDFRKKVLLDISEELNYIEHQLDKIKETEATELELLNHIRTLHKLTVSKKDKIKRLIQRLEARLKQKDYKYSTKDVLLVTTAIKELDKFYSFYIVQTVKNLEPIINDIISKVDFELQFKLDSKGDFDIVLFRNGDEFSYKDLSAGQRLILTIAFQIALLLEKGDSGLIVADEGFSSLDNENILMVYELFKDLPLQLISIIHRFDEPVENINIINLGEIDARKAV